MHTQVCLVLVHAPFTKQHRLFLVEGRLSGILTKQPYHWKRLKWDSKGLSWESWPRSPTLRWAQSIIILTHTRYSLQITKNVPITKFKLDKNKNDTCKCLSLCQSCGGIMFWWETGQEARKHLQKAFAISEQKIQAFMHSISPPSSCRLLPFSRELKHGGKKQTQTINKWVWLHIKLQ